jgi:hypothetical protein
VLLAGSEQPIAIRVIAYNGHKLNRYIQHGQVMRNIPGNPSCKTLQAGRV